MSLPILPCFACVPATDDVSVQQGHKARHGILDDILWCALDLACLARLWRIGQTVTARWIGTFSELPMRQ